MVVAIGTVAAVAATRVAATTVAAAKGALEIVGEVRFWYYNLLMPIGLQKNHMQPVLADLLQPSIISVSTILYFFVYKVFFTFPNVKYITVVKVNH